MRYNGKNISFGLLKYIAAAVVAVSLFAACSENSATESGMGSIALADGSGDWLCRRSMDGVVAASSEGYYRCQDGLWVGITENEAVLAEEIIGIESGDSKTAIDIVVDEFDELPKCLGENENDVAYVEFEGEVYQCTEGARKWNRKELAEIYIPRSSSSQVSVELSSSIVSSVSSSSIVSSVSSSSIASSVSSSSMFSFVSSSSVRPVGISSSGNVDLGSSSSGRRSSSSFVAAYSTASGSYDCSVYTCVNTLYLNQEMLADGKYGEFLDDRDEQVYRTIAIGNQTWLAQNLNYESSGSSCYGGKAENCKIYGRIYTLSGGETFMKSVCPKGFRMPSYEDFKELLLYVGEGEMTVTLEISSWPAYTTSKKTAVHLKSLQTWKEGFLGTDDYGFSVISAGAKWNYGSYYGMGNVGKFWTTTYHEGSGRYVNLFFPDDDADYDENHTTDEAFFHLEGSSYGRSIRCLME